MATVAQPASFSNGSHTQESEQHTEHGPPRFTAVNGKETAVHNSNIPSAAGNPIQGRESTDFTGISSSANGSRPDQGQRKTSSAGAGQSDEHGSQEPSPQTTPNGANKNKRKRSESIERQDPLSLSDDAPGIPARSLEANAEFPMHPEANNNAKLLPSNVEYPSQISTSYSHPEAREDQAINGSTGSWPDYDSHLISQAQKAQNLDSSDAQLVEALQRETHSTDSIEQKSWITGQASASGESDQRSAQPYTQEKSQGVVQVGPKRKRVFSNRTKTGCLTCRRRKKKCDEQHPACES